MNERNGFSGLGVFFAFLAGAAAGAATAMLMTPTTGEETRQKLKELANNGRDTVARVPKAIASAYSQATEVAKDAFSEAYESAKDRVGKPIS